MIRRQRRLWRRHANETTVEADTAVQESEEPADTVTANAEVGETPVVDFTEEAVNMEGVVKSELELTGGADGQGR